MSDLTELQKIEAIIDEHIRPALQSHGGDLQVIDYEEESKILRIKYQGACGGCPGALAGTLRAIQGVLSKEYRSDIVVQPAQ